MQSLIRTHLPSVRSDSALSSARAHQQQWIAIAGGTFSAAIASLFIALLLGLTESHSPAATLLVAIAAVTNAALAGVFGVWLAQLTLTDDLPTDSHQISL